MIRCESLNSKASSSGTSTLSCCELLVYGGSCDGTGPSFTCTGAIPAEGLGKVLAR